MLSPAQINRFGETIRKALRDRSKPAFAKAYVRTLISDIKVSRDRITISGSTTALAQQSAAFATNGKLVPSFEQEWRTGEDSNPRPLDS